MLAKITHALPDVRDLRTSGNGCYQSPPFRQSRDQKKRRIWGREWSRGRRFRRFDALSMRNHHCLENCCFSAVSDMEYIFREENRSPGLVSGIEPSIASRK